MLGEYEWARCVFPSLLQILGSSFFLLRRCVSEIASRLWWRYVEIGRWIRSRRVGLMLISLLGSWVGVGGWWVWFLGGWR